MSGRSLQFRLAWRLSLVFFAALSALLAGFLWRAIAVADATRERAVQAQAEDILRHLRLLPEGGAAVDLPPSLADLYERGDGRYAFAILDRNGAPKLASSPAIAAAAAPQLVGREPGFLQFRSGDHSYFGYALVEPQLTVLAAEDIGQHHDVLIDAVLAELVQVSLWWLLPLILITVGVGVATVRGGLRPLRAVSRAAEQISLTTLQGRLPERGLSRELQPVVGALNAALARLEEGAELQRRFLADAAHELRTPLAVLTARLDELRADPTLAPLRADVARMNRLVEQLLRFARLEAAPLAVDEVLDLRALVAEAIAVLGPLAVKQGRDIALAEEGGAVRVLGNRPALLAAVINLLENALVQTPPGGLVEVEVAPGAVIRVMDRGPGVPPDQQAAIFDRFHRAPGALGQGSGLGLAIVAATARAHGGRVEVAQRPGGGAVFSLHLPPAEASPATPAACAR